MNRFIKITLVAVAALGISRGWAAMPEVAFKNGEKLTFMVSYRAKLIPNTDVAEVVLSVDNSHYESQPALKITAKADVMPFFKWFFDMHDVYSAWVNPETLKPIYATCDIREGNYRFSSRFYFDWNKSEVNTVYRNLKRPNDSYKVMALSDYSYDGLSLFYNLRSTAPNEFLIGQTQHMKLVIEDTIRVVYYKFLGREPLKVKGLGEFNTLKFSCQLATTTGVSFEDGTEFFLWITDDRNRIPLLIESPIKVGSIRARLMKYTNLKYQLDSKIK